MTSQILQANRLSR